YPLQAKFYLQMKEDVLVGELTYHYGENKVNPLTKSVDQDGAGIIVRDVQKEQEIMRLIEQANFHYNREDLYIRMDEEDEVYQLMYVILPQLEALAQIYTASDVRQLILEEMPLPSTSVTVQEGTNLLEIGFDIAGVDEEEVQDVLTA